MTRGCAGLNETDRKTSWEKPWGGEGVKTMEMEKAPKGDWPWDLPGRAGGAEREGAEPRPLRGGPWLDLEWDRKLSEGCTRADLGDRRRDLCFRKRAEASRRPEGEGWGHTPWGLWVQKEWRWWLGKSQKATQDSESQALKCKLSHLMTCSCLFL